MIIQILPLIMIGKRSKSIIQFAEHLEIRLLPNNNPKNPYSCFRCEAGRIHLKMMLIFIS